MTQVRRAQVYEALRDWVHESPLSLCGTGSDTCDDHELADALADLVMSSGDPALAPLARQRAVDETRRRRELLEVWALGKTPAEESRAAMRMLVTVVAFALAALISGVALLGLL